VTLCLALVLSGAVPPFTAAGEPVSNVLYTAVLEEYVQDGRVDYSGLCEDERFASYVNQLATVDPDTIGDNDERLAFWINLYNAYTLKIICDNYPLESINDLHLGGLVVGTVLKKTVWDKKFVKTDGEELSLNHVEHEIIRSEFRDPRAHFAIVCASVSCPPLRAESYEGGRLGDQLDDQARIFFSEPDKNYFDVEKKEAHLSKILDWFSKDFGGNDEEILLFVSTYLPKDLASAIRADPTEWKIKYTDYDWRLNE